MPANGGGGGMDPFDLIMGIIHMLTPEQRAAVAAKCGALAPPPAPPKAPPPKPVLTPCQRNGHKEKIVGRTPGGLFTHATITTLCEKCGRTRTKKI